MNSPERNFPPNQNKPQNAKAKWQRREEDMEAYDFKWVGFLHIKIMANLGIEETTCKE